MNKLITIFVLLLIGISVKATDYYVATAANGGSNAKTGLAGQPWLTLSYACAQVPAGNHIIHIGAGTFNENTQSVLKTGVDIDGAGVAGTIINSSYSGVLLLLSSSVESTQGDNTISNIYFNGNMVGDRAIDVMARDNVEIHHCTFVNFFTSAVQFFGKVNGSSGTPGIWATDLEFHDNIVTNCAKYVVGDQGYGNLRMGGTIGMRVYNNVITQTQRTSNLHGYCIKFCGGGWNKALKVYDNVLIMPEVSSNWDFAFEMFHSLGGIEIYRNRIRGTLDWSSSSSGAYVSLKKGDYDFALKVYDNYFYNTRHLGWTTIGVDVEDHFSGGIYIYRNKFENLRYGIYNSVKTNATGTSIQKDVYIYYNIVLTPGITTTDPSAAFKLGHATATTYDNWNVWNNTAYGAAGESTHGMRVFFGGNATNISIMNNIMVGFLHSGLYLYDSNITGLQIQNNIFFGNGSNAPVYSNNTLTGETISGNLFSNPNLISTTNFHLQSSSPAINAGLSVGLTTDYDEVAISGLPDIGAYEYSVSSVVSQWEGTNSVKVYPNPVSDELSIEIEDNNNDLNFKILNSIGRIVFIGKLKEKTTIPTSGFAPGLYTVKIEDGNSFLHKKIIIL